MITLKLKQKRLMTATQWSHQQFDQLADILLNKTLLVANSKRFRLSEIEFYYCGPEHMDQYTHCSDEQQMNGKFYFHKYKSGTYKSGTYKGLDLTFGHDQTYFGVLIRSIQETGETGEIVEGPCKSVNLLLKQFDCEVVKDFVEDKTLPLDIYDQQYKFHIVDDSHLTPQPIHKGPRIGLSDKYPLFRDLKYRYVINRDKIHKQRKTLDQVV